VLGDPVGFRVGVNVGDTEGAAVGEEVPGCKEVGVLLGDKLGEIVSGLIVGLTLGEIVGEVDGDVEGEVVPGCCEVGVLLGEALGDALGE